MRASGFGGAGWAAFATMHGKERVVAPLFFARLQIDVWVARGIDTDALGTFTGERPRRGSAKDAAIAKARLALEACPAATYGIGSEGSFNPDSVLPFVTSGHEVIALTDRDGKLALFGHDVTTETNCTEVTVTTIDEARDAARRFGFPNHAAVVTHAHDVLVKGIQSEDDLRATVAETLRAHGSACIQSDMRAHMNPTRMRSIERAALRLIASAESLCPLCKRPGYEIVDRLPGLPCRECGAQTDLTRKLVYGCLGCEVIEERDRSDGRTQAFPGECNACNP